MTSNLGEKGWGKGREGDILTVGAKDAECVTWEGRHAGQSGRCDIDMMGFWECAG